MQRSDVSTPDGAIVRAPRLAAPRRSGATVWFTGLPGAGKSTIAAAVEERLVQRGRAAYVLDGDKLREGLCRDLGFSAADRSEQARRAAHIAKLLADAGIVALVALISPYAADRERARRLHEEAALPFAEAFVHTSLEECERRDPKGLYARARAGDLRGLTGVDDPYEPPASPEIELTPDVALPRAVEAVMRWLPG